MLGVEATEVFDPDHRGRDAFTSDSRNHHLVLETDVLSYHRRSTRNPPEDRELLHGLVAAPGTDVARRRGPDRGPLGVGELVVRVARVHPGPERIAILVLLAAERADGVHGSVL